MPRDPKDVFKPAAWSTKYASERRLCGMLMSGTGAMRDAGTERLPMFTGEDPNDYETRKKKALLEPYFRRAVGYLTGKAMAKPVRLEADVPEIIRGREAADTTPGIEGWAERIEGRRKGPNLHEFAKRWLRDRLAFGGAAVLVDHPPFSGAGSRKGEKGRPYAILIPAGNILGPITEEVDGEEILTEFRYLECYQARAEKGWGTESREQVRVLYRRNPDTPEVDLVWRETYRKGEDGTEYLVLDGPDAPKYMAPLTEIPVTPFPEWQDWRPPLMDLADLNAAAYETRSENQEYFSYVKRPAWKWFGTDPEQMAKCKTIGGRFIVWSDKPPGATEFDVVETTGAAVAVAMKDYDALIMEMERESLRPLVKDTTQTLGEKRIDAAEASSWLQSEMLGLKNALEEVLMHFAAWRALPSGGSVKVNEDFGLSQAEQAALQALKDARQGVNGVPDLSRRTLLEGLVEQKALPEEFDVEEEERRLAEEDANGAREMQAEIDDLREMVAKLANRSTEPTPTPPSSAEPSMGGPQP